MKRKRRGGKEKREAERRVRLGFWGDWKDDGLFAFFILKFYLKKNNVRMKRVLNN